MKNKKAKSFLSYDENGHGLNGCDGIPGYPGQSGGNFYTKFNGIIGQKLLHVNLSGGKGGRGQDGGDGGNGKTINNIYLSDDSAKKKLLEKENLIEETEIISGLYILKYYEYKITPYGHNGGDGGKGGNGGFGGYSGNVDINCNKVFKSHFKIQDGNGLNGTDGDPGKYGKAQHMEGYHGIYTIIEQRTWWKITTGMMSFGTAPLLNGGITFLFFDGWKSFERIQDDAHDGVSCITTHKKGIICSKKCDSLDSIYLSELYNIEVTGVSEILDDILIFREN